MPAITNGDLLNILNGLGALLFALIITAMFYTVRFLASYHALQDARRRLKQFQDETDDTVFELGDDGEIVQVKRKRG